MGLEQQAEDEFLSYKQLGKDMRKKIKSELKAGEYDHLTNPDNKKGVKIPTSVDQLLDLKCRFSIMPRKQFRKGLGRNTTVGRNEIILALYGDFANKENPYEGFIPQEDYKARIIFGDNFVNPAVESIVQSGAGEHLYLLREGLYDSFVREMMHVINHAIDLYKNVEYIEFEQ